MEKVTEFPASPVQFDTGAFIEKLSLLKAGADKINTIAPSSGLIFFDGKHMFTFNGNVYCGTESPFDVPEQVALSYNAIMKVLKGKNGYGECAFAPDGSCAVFKVVGVRTESMARVTADTTVGKLLNLPKAEPNSWKAIPDPVVFKEALKISESVHDKSSTGTSLENLHLTKEFMECGTATQFIRAVCEVPIDNELLVLGGVLSKIAASTNLTDIQISDDGSWFLLRDGLTYFAVPVSTAEYIPDANLRLLFFPNDPDAVVLEFPDADFNKELRDEIVRGTTFNEKEVALTLEGSTCHAVFSDVINTNQFSTTINGVKTNCTSPVKLTIVPQVLMQLLSTSEGKLNVHSHTVTVDTGAFAYVVTHFGIESPVASA